MNLENLTPEEMLWELEDLIREDLENYSQNKPNINTLLKETETTHEDLFQKPYSSTTSSTPQGSTTLR